MIINSLVDISLRTFIFFFFMAVSVSYGSSRARGWIRAAVEAYATATAIPDLRCICDLHCSLWQHWILNPLSKARDRTHILQRRQVLNPLSHNENSQGLLYFWRIVVILSALPRLKSINILEFPGSLVVKDSALSLLWFRLRLWLQFSPCLEKFWEPKV